MSSRSIEYESILGADVSVEGCPRTGGGSGGDATFGKLSVPFWGMFHSCEVRYSNAMNAAVGKSPSMTVRWFYVPTSIAVVKDGDGSNLWYEGVYPEDTELRESFRLFAEGGELQDEFADGGCASARTPECAQLIVDNLDNWAAWYGTNS